jgi:hypothetical protein
MMDQQELVAVALLPARACTLHRVPPWTVPVKLHTALTLAESK